MTSKEITKRCIHNAREAESRNREVRVNACRISFRKKPDLDVRIRDDIEVFAI